MSVLNIIGVPLDLGAARRGVEMGPAALRLAGLADRLRALGHTVTDTGNIIVPERDTIAQSSDGPKYLAEITAVCSALSQRTEHAILDGQIPIVLGGDHSLGAGSVAGASRAVKSRGESLGLLWIDAHTDLHLPETSQSRNVHGMPVSHLLGRGYPALSGLGGPNGAVRPTDVVYIGLRSVDPAERRHLREFGMKKTFSMQDIDRRGIGAVMDEAIGYLFVDGRRPLYVSYDLDFVDPSHAPGVGTPVIGGASVREAHFVAEALAETHAVVGCDLVETCTPLDERNRTAELGVSLLASLFGETILAG